MDIQARRIRLATAIAAAAFIAACGGGEDSDPAVTAQAPAAMASAELRGAVASSGAEGSRVFLDLNGNRTRDEGEAQALAGANGAFALPVPALSAGELASAMLVAEVPGSAHPLMAPASSSIAPGGVVTGTAEISSFTTAVAAEVAVNGMKPAEAEVSVHADIARGVTGSAEKLLRSSKGRKAPAPEGYTRIIVKFNESVTDPRDAARTLAGAHGARLHRTWTRAMKGFVADVPDAGVDAFLDTLDGDARVESAEEDQVAEGSATVQSGAAWGLDRVDQRALPLSGSYSYNGNGAGVHLYVIDSGLRATHTEFTGRVEPGYNATGDSRGTNDCHGHGTHVSGIAGGTTFGMAKGVTIVPVRVLGCDNTGSWSDIIEGIDWMIAHAVKPAVANMSITGGKSSTVDSAVTRAISAGITMVLAAGNNGANACNYSPARTAAAITVGASNASDARPSWSNWGSCVDVFAPGQDILSAYNTSDTATYTMYGTSMATPHVTGLAALMLQQNPVLTPAQVAAAIKAAATTNKLTSIGSGSPNLMLYASVGTVATAPVDPVGPVEPIDPVVDPVEPVPPPVTTPPVAGTPVSIASMSGAAIPAGRRWSARVTLAVKDGSGALVPGVVAKGSFTRGGTGLSCTTASNGTCSIESTRMGGTVASVTFTIESLSKSGMTYSSAGNAVSTVSVSRP